jgi:hypothetical protein
MKTWQIIGIYGLVVMTIFIIGYYFAEYLRKRDEQIRDHYRKWNEINDLIATFTVNGKNYFILTGKLKILGDMKYKNKAKTHELVLKFLKKFYEIAKA